MEGEERKTQAIPEEFRNDPTLAWAEKVEANPIFAGEASFAQFVRLKDEYERILRKFSKVLRISDGYQASLKELNAFLEKAAQTDFLTGLYNRREMLERLAAETSRAKRHGLVYCVLEADIDLFKNVNDTFGHEAGDRVLVAVAELIKACLRLEDSCARWGGEEFLVFLPHTENESAASVAEKIRADVEGFAFEYDGRPVRVTVSIGIAQYASDDAIDDVIRRADEAMYAAKMAGRNAAAAFRSGKPEVLSMGRNRGSGR
jgi:diguanylate cyclase (GGDEF)-like protein